MPSLIASSTGDWWTRRREATADAAAQQMFDRLRADPTSFARSPSRRAAVTLALTLIVLAVALAALDVLVLVTVRAWWIWLLLVLDVLLLAWCRPRRARMVRRARLLPSEDFPGMHDLVEALAERVGVRAPRTIAVSYDLNAWVQPFGWLHRPALVIGMPMWCAMTTNERLGLLGHELGHLRHRDLSAGRLVGSGLSLLGATITALRPGPHSPVWGGAYFEAITTRLAAYLQLVASVPFRLLHLWLFRLDARASQYDEYLADRRAATVAGSTAVRQMLALDVVGTWTRVAAEVRAGGDPFACFAAVSPPSEARIAAHVRHSQLTPVRADASHPPDHLRIRLLEAGFVPPGTGLPAREVTDAAERELSRLQPHLQRRMTDILKTTFYS